MDIDHAEQQVRQVDEDGRIMALPRRRATQDDEEARKGEIERLRNLAQGSAGRMFCGERRARRICIDRAYGRKLASNRLEDGGILILGWRAARACGPR